MKTKIFILSIILSSTFSFGQNDSNLFGIVRKNYYSIQTDPFDPNFQYEVFDSATVRLGKLNTNTGFVENISQTGAALSVNLTGAALNPYTNSYLFFGGDKFVTLDLNSGQVSNQVSVFNSNGESYFDNFRFNNSDSTVYGLARRNYYNTDGSFIYGEMFLSKLIESTGEIQQISQNSIGQGFALAGSAIDPFQMVYYYSKGDAIVGLDMYNGEIYSTFPIDWEQTGMFDNFTYSCADTSLYGLQRKNYYSMIYDEQFPDFPMQNLDSTSVKLAKLNLNTGEIIEVSQNNLNVGGYSLNASSAIDPIGMKYYFSSGNNIVAVSMISGQIVETNDLIFEDGSYFDLMRNFNNCKDASRARLSSQVASIQEKMNSPISISPNPSSSNFKIIMKDELENGEILITNQLGEIVAKVSSFSGNEIEFTNQKLSAGIYYITVNTSKSGQIFTEKLLIQP